MVIQYLNLDHTQFFFTTPDISIPQVLRGFRLVILPSFAENLDRKFSIKLNMNQQEEILPKELSGPSLRRGKWTVEEERYTEKIINDFENGTLDVPGMNSF